MSKSVFLAGCQIQVSRIDRTSPPIQGEEVGAVLKSVKEATGHRTSVQHRARQEGTIQKSLREASSRFQINTISHTIKVTDEQAKIIVGIQGKRIMSLKKKCQVKIDIPRRSLDNKCIGTKTLIIRGSPEAVDIAKVEVNKILVDG